MNYLLPILLFSPLISLAIGFSLKNHHERQIFISSIASLLVNMALLLTILVYWVINGRSLISFSGLVLYKAPNSDFSINLFIDAYSLAYALVSTFLTITITIFSRFYVHREKGYKRFFNNLKFFYVGLMLVLLSGNLESLFIGWEILGVTSFFLIGFYRERYLPVKNALKVISLYRIADVALLLAIWLNHHYFGFTVNFYDLHGLPSSETHAMNETFYSYFVPSLFLIAAMVKSAQFPFSSWLPRAMEGPTTSSAIFYGALSAHIGIFLLIRTSPFWESNPIFHVVIGGVGAITCLVATITARVQSTIKTQIAYSSIAQIGLMFIEVSLGLYTVAVIHFAGNALLRSYQLLVSPSVLSYKIHDQFFHFKKPLPQRIGRLKDKIRMSLFMFGLLEFRMDKFMYKTLWMPLKKLGNMLNFLDDRKTYVLALPPFLIGLYGLTIRDQIPVSILRFLPEAFALVGFIFILKSFVERKSVRNAWVLIVINQLYQSMAIGFNEVFELKQVMIYLSGIVVSTLIGLWVVSKLRRGAKEVSLNTFHGHSYAHPRLAFIFVIACLGLAGFPITPSFIGEDLMLGHIQENQFPLLILISLNLILDGLAIFRIYSRLFLGPHTKGYHEVALRSS